MNVDDNISFWEIAAYSLNDRSSGLFGGFGFLLIFGLILAMFRVYGAKKPFIRDLLVSLLLSLVISTLFFLISIVTSTKVAHYSKVAAQVNKGYDLKDDFEIGYWEIKDLYDHSDEIKKLTSFEDIVVDGKNVTKSEKTLYGLLDENAGTVTLFVSSSEEQELTELELANR